MSQCATVGHSCNTVHGWPNWENWGPKVAKRKIIYSTVQKSAQMTDYNKPPKIEPIKMKEFEVKQSKFEVVPQLPCRSIILGPSGSGKTVLLTNLILNIYRGCFERIFIFSPSINVDYVWEPVKKYIAEDMKVNIKDEKCFFDHYNSEDLQNIIDTQHKVTEYMKKRNIRNYIQF